MSVEPDPAFTASTEAALPYAGTSGRGGSSASREMKAGEDADGTTGRRQAAALAHLSQSGPAGITARELGELEGWHHGQSSGALSTLHKVGRVARLAKVRRGRQSVYVLPEYAQDRAVAEFGGHKDPREPDPAAVYGEAEFVNRYLDLVQHRTGEIVSIGPYSAELLARILKGEK